ncbi:IPExxxVDY family protein [Flagellimonas sp. S174]|uniref:IPExxxVDY family protein n=1 Tax=Flagellimonas sp. S174 TaxID=3410790 RepID=UPI003BF54174
MSATRKIIEAYYDDDFQLIAIRSGLDDFSLAYALNNGCDLRLKRTQNDLNYGSDLSFSIFDWEDEINQNYWVLFTNTCEQEIGISEGLFANDVSQKTDFLVSEHKEVDYFLRIDTDDMRIRDNIVKVINAMPNIVTAYSIDPNALKSKSNLIF